MSPDKSVFRIDHQSSIPHYHQIKENLRDAIKTGALLPDDPLPLVRDLAAMYSVSPSIVRQVVDDLVHEGILRHIQGIGKVVAQPKVVQEFPTLLGFSARMRQGGHTVLSRVLAQQFEPTRGSVARRLHLVEGASVLRLARLRIVDNAPLMIETSFLSAERFPDLIGDDFALRSLYDVLTTRYGIQIIELDQTLEPVLMTAYEAKLLDSTPGSPALLLEVVAYAGEDDPFEFSKAVVRGDKCQYFFRMRSSQ